VAAGGPAAGESARLPTPACRRPRAGLAETGMCVRRAGADGGVIYTYDSTYKAFQGGCSVKSNDFITPERFCGSQLTVLQLQFITQWCPPRSQPASEYLAVVSPDK